MAKLKSQKQIDEKKQSKRLFLKHLFTFFIFLNFFHFGNFKKIKYSKKLWILDKKD